MLYMMHEFSKFEGFVEDPITGIRVPVLSMFQTEETMENAVKENLVTSAKVDQIKKLIDLEDSRQMFEESESTASITATFM